MNMNEKQSDKRASKKKSNYDLDLLLKLNEQMQLEGLKKKPVNFTGWVKLVVFAIFI